MKKLLKILLVIGILFAALLTAVVVTVGIRMVSQVKAFDRTGIDVSHVPDGCRWCIRWSQRDGSC